jgi:predicted GIY-YIG superfamily endonuclease
MADIDTLGIEIGKLFTGVAKDIYARFTQEDKDDLEAYAKNVARLTLKLATEQDPAKKAAIDDNLKTFQNATLLMIARYEIIAASSVEKASVAALKLTIEAVIKIVIASV